MMDAFKDYNLTKLNTMGLASKAEYFTRVQSQTELLDALDFAIAKQLKVHILGGGSNVLLPPIVSGLVIQIGLKGWHFLSKAKDKNKVQLIAASGENWHELVRASVEKGYFGIENLSLIPGTVGAAPVQNIGAYGVELADVLDSVKALDCTTHEVVIFTVSECMFAYRDSLFKHQSGRYIILEVILNLSKELNPKLDYPVLRSEINLKLGENQGASSPSPELISNVVISIRQSKLPDPSILPNAGSFYKNPIIDTDQYNNLIKRYPLLSGYPQPNGKVKVAAGWLIEQAEWKGFRDTHVGVHDKQALVLINHHQGNLNDVERLSDRIINSVQAKFGIHLEPEPVKF